MCIRKQYLNIIFSTVGIFILTICSANICAAIHKISLSFSLDDYKIINMDGNKHVIESVGRSAYSGCDYGMPLIPWYPEAIDIGANDNILSIDVKCSNAKLIMDSISLLQVTPPIPTDAVNAIRNKKPEYPECTEIYPSTQVKNTWNMPTITGSRVMMIASPFKYDPNGGKLYFYDQIDITLNTVSSDMPVRSANASLSVLNPKIEKVLSYSDNMDIDYVIITLDSLSQSFKPLIEWKRQKGLNADIITLETILDAYPEATPQLKIKRCLYNLYETRNLKYALLGGDAYRIPGMMCQAKIDVLIDSAKLNKELPSDLFYASFAGAFDWDSNHNDIYGEPDDNVSLIPDIHVSRLPLSHNKDIVNTINKIIRYESNPPTNEWKNNMLMAGAKIEEKIYDSSSTSWQSDSYLASDLVYRRNIEPFWKGSVDFYFDTYRSNSIPFNLGTINNLMSEGYAFWDISCHGYKEGWSFGFEYSIDNALKMKSSQLSLIVTSACHTNFIGTPSMYTPSVSNDASKKIVDGDNGKLSPLMSLGSAFLRNSDSGVVAYIGSVDIGISSNTPVTYSNSSSEGINGNILKNIFSNEIGTRRLSSCFENAKNIIIPMANYEQVARYLIMYHTLCGDPEMEVYPDVPKKIGYVNITNNKGASKQLIGLNNVSGVSIRIGYPNDKGIYEFEDLNVSDRYNPISFVPRGKQFALSIKKDGYVPFVAYHQFDTQRLGDTVYMRDRIYEDNMDIIAPKVVIGEDVSSTSGNEVIFKSGTTRFSADDVEFLSGVTIEAGAEIRINN